MKPAGVCAYAAVLFCAAAALTITGLERAASAETNATESTDAPDKGQEKKPESGTPEKEVSPPRAFRPTEKVPVDMALDFPVDI